MTQTTIDVETLRDMLNREQSVTVLDIRHTEDYTEWAIPGSIHLDAYDALKRDDPNALAGLDVPENVPVVTICAAGKTSAIATQQLRDRGLEALTLRGGMKAWSLAWNSAEVPLTGNRAQVIQIRRTGKGCLSYMVGSHGMAAVIDAAVDPQVYLDLAKAHNWKIIGVLDTHVHADHLSRSRKLAESSSAALYLPDQDRVSYPFKAIREEDIIEIGGVKLTAVPTPGHTLESTCYLLEDGALFSGDTLFLAGVGRPDLEASPQEARRRASLLYNSLKRLLDLPSETILLPGHTSEPIPFDGKPLCSRLSQVKEKVEVLNMAEEAFVETILARIPPTPPNHHRIVELNESGTFPEGDPTELEAGANRCAIS